MSHGIGATDHLFSVREKPWHGLGTVVEEDVVDVEHALQLAGLDWRVRVEPILTGSGLLVEGRKATVREGSAREGSWIAPQALGIVSDRYRVVQNREAFAWLETLLGGEVQFETAGSINDGRRVWVLVKIPDAVEVVAEPMALYMFCVNSHDGTSSMLAAASRIRIVCQNTLTWALNSAARTYSFRHVGDVNAKLDEARDALQVTLDWDKAFRQMAEELAVEPVSTQRFDKGVVTPLLGLDEEDLGDRARRSRERSREKLIDLFSPDAPTAGQWPHTAWHAANAVAEFSDWMRPRSSVDQVHRSFEDGSLKQRGLELVRQTVWVR